MQNKEAHVTAATALKIRRPLLSLRSALSLILLIWLSDTLIYTLQTENTPAAFLQFLPGALAVAVLFAAGLSIQDCYLRPAPLSRTGLMLLGASLLLMPILWLTGRWIGWNWMDALIYAPASGISQELFFRAGLLPVLLATLPAKPTRAITLHALLFSAWHVPKVIMTAPIGGIISVAAVTFVAGFLWAKQVRHDKSVFWLMGFHSIILFINSFFTWG